jgi:alkylation response protein AidB-like acyl-CoA dehydrogenase
MTADPPPAAIEGQARDIADQLLFPAAMDVDAADRVPAGHLDALAGAGLYGIAGPVSAGGLDCDLATTCNVIEIMAGACLATTFVWIQHHSAVRALAATGNGQLRSAWLPELCRGSARAGIALGGARPGPPLLRARLVPGGYVFDGSAPWVTGWGLVDVVHAIARDDSGNLVAALLPARESASLTAARLDLTAVHASCTVELTFASHFVPAELISGVSTYADWLARDQAGLRPNGSLALGLAARCVTLTGLQAGQQADAASVALARELEACRARLDEAGPQDLPAARAAAAELAYRGAGTLTALAGSQSVLFGQHPQRLVREALFLLVFGSRPAIKSSLVELISRRCANP